MNTIRNNLLQNLERKKTMILNLKTENMDRTMTHQIFKFITDAQRFKINFKIADKISGYHPHVGLTAQEGISILFRKTGDSGIWHNLEIFIERFDTTIFMNHLVKKGERYEVLIYGPILNNIEKIEVESYDGTILESVNAPKDISILVAGGLISHGMGCTTSSLTFPNILGRRLNASVDYITFNDRNYLDKVPSYLKENNKEYDFGLLEIDYSNQDDEVVKNYLKNVIKEMQGKCKTIICWSSIPRYKYYKKSFAYQIFKELKDNNLYWVDYSFIHDEKHADFCTYSGNFINDSGNVIIAQKLQERIRSL